MSHQHRRATCLLQTMTQSLGNQRAMALATTLLLLIGAGGQMAPFGVVVPKRSLPLG